MTEKEKGEFEMCRSFALLTLAAVVVTCFTSCGPAERLGRATRAGNAPWFNVRDYGASGDRKDLATASIQKAIDACGAAGGGSVYFPPGGYTTATIELKSNVTLHVEAGATIYASQNEADYTPVKVYEHARQKHEVLIYAKGCTNIGIRGRGTIDGQARHVLREPDFLDSFIESEIANARRAGVSMKRYFREPPHVFLVFMVECDGVTIRDVTMTRSPLWTVHAQWCSNVFVRGVRIYSQLDRGVNADGIDIDGCRNVLISDCIIETADDAICLKTTLTGGRTQPCENVAVTNCCLISSSTALKLGTESHADFRNVVFSNCVIRNSNRGMSIVIRDGGTARDVLFANITFEGKRRDYYWWGDGDAIYLTLLKRTAGSKLGMIRDVRFSNITARCQGTSRILGFPGGRRLRNIRLANVQLVLEAEDKPDKRATGALLVRGVDGLQIDALDVDWDTGRTEKKWQSALRLDNVSDFSVSRVRARQGLDGSDAAAIHLDNCSGGALRASRATEGTNLFLRATGKNTRDLWIHQNDWSHAKKGFEADASLAKDAVRLTNNRQH